MERELRPCRLCNSGRSGVPYSLPRLLLAFVLHTRRIVAPPCTRRCCSSAFAGLEVPLPAVVQEYVDHGGALWKVYCAGEQVFWTQRRSTPDLGPLARLLAEDPAADLPTSVGFDSLKSLPTSLPWARQAASTAGAAPGGAAAAAGREAEAPPGHELMRQPTFEAVASALRARLGLTLFGFDLVFDRAAGAWSGSRPSGVRWTERWGSAASCCCSSCISSWRGRCSRFAPAPPPPPTHVHTFRRAGDSGRQLLSVLQGHPRSACCAGDRAAVALRAAPGGDAAAAAEAGVAATHRSRSTGSYM